MSYWYGGRSAVDRHNNKIEVKEILWEWIIVWSSILAVLLAVVLMAGCPRYNVWERAMKGKAELSRAEWNRQVAIEEAQARLESAKLDAQAEIERAHGVAEANEIIGESLKNNEAYLRYLWINGLHDGSSETIYIPTEANLPILEAVRKMQPAEVTLVVPEED